MVETTTNISKFRQKRLKGLSSKSKETTSINNYFYPKTDLYTREEFELLDTIYSDEPSAEEKKEIKVETQNDDDDWGAVPAFLRRSKLK